MSSYEEDLGVALFHSYAFTIADIVEVVQYRESKGWVPNGYEYGFDAEHGDYFIAMTFVKKDSLPSVLGSGVHADAWQGPTPLSEGPSDNAVKCLKCQYEGAPARLPACQLCTRGEYRG